MTAPRDNRLLDLAILRHRHEKTDTRFVDEALADRWHPKAVRLRCQVLIDKGLMDCGVSARTGWLTDAGLARLAELSRELA